MDEVQYGTKISWIGYYCWPISKYSHSAVRYRMDPVPGTRKWRGNKYAYYRHPATKQLLTLRDKSYREDMLDLTSWQQHQLELRDRYIPHAWDDIPYARRGFSWKYHRKQQYRKISIM